MSNTEQTVLFIGGPADGKRTVMRNPLPRVMRVVAQDFYPFTYPDAEIGPDYTCVEYELQKLYGNSADDVFTYYDVYVIKGGAGSIIQTLLDGYGRAGHKK